MKPEGMNWFWKSCADCGVLPKACKCETFVAKRDDDMVCQRNCGHVERRHVDGKCQVPGCMCVGLELPFPLRDISGRLVPRDVEGYDGITLRCRDCETEATDAIRFRAERACTDAGLPLSGLWWRCHACQPKLPQAARVSSVTKSKPGEGTKCDRPNREAFAAAMRKGGPVDEKDLPKCGAPAVVLIVTNYENAESTRWNCCKSCRPIDLTGGRIPRPN